MFFCHRKTLPFVVYRQKVSGITTPSYRVVEHFCVVKISWRPSISDATDPVFNAPAFEQVGKVFDNSIVMAVSSSTHAVNDGLQETQFIHNL